MGTRPGNNPKRRIASANCLTPEQRSELKNNVVYVGSGHHKRFPADYGFERANPRPTKSLCDLDRIVDRQLAQELLNNGIDLGLFSEPSENGYPKYVWSVTAYGEVYEAKTDTHGTGQYHGYPLENEDAMRDYVRAVWKERCQEIGR